MARDPGAVGGAIGAHAGLRPFELEQLRQAAQTLVVEGLNALDLLTDQGELLILGRNHLAQAVDFGLELQNALRQNLLAALQGRPPAREQSALGGQGRRDDRRIEVFQRARRRNLLRARLLREQARLGRHEMDEALAQLFELGRAPEHPRG